MGTLPTLLTVCVWGGGGGGGGGGADYAVMWSHVTLIEAEWRIYKSVI